MRVVILSAMTGNGHNAVSAALEKRFMQMGVAVAVINDFYEKLSPYTSMMSEFYNLLQMRSKALCKVYTELAMMENSKRQNDIYTLIYEAIGKFYHENDADVIISTTPLINRYMIRYKIENNIKIPYYIVVTDPFIPMYPGFECKDGSGYFCENVKVKEYLIKQGIDEKKIVVSGYPLKQDYIIEKRQIDTKKNKYKVVINSGANGNLAYLNIVDRIQKLISAYELKIVLLCGKNEVLYNLASKRYKNDEHIEVKLYENDMSALLRTADICVTKPGANAIFECLYMRVPILIEGLEGYLYQERGIKSFLEENKVGMCFESLDELIPVFQRMLIEYNSFLTEMKKIEKRDGALCIYNTIMQVV